ncbi:MAG: type II secretion system F family protein [Thermoanaerobaculaceae bacterium]|nr:type II secretion system F family protein [Thermoanaerobaculaceae bacterium]MDI9622989.1 type II secretion system F family protein [Acidobacteriota bacterium]NLH12150.1 type II secretion system F family protein [Holophagae bacterium]HPW54968.1 type II secretion system F family protein [Thermoanaerobaculaceae bacterium]
MPSFEWKGRDRAGRPQSGVLVADTKDAALAVLRRQQVVPITVKEKGKEIALPKVRGGVSDKALAVFTRQFSVMIDAGLPLVQCLQILGEQQENKAFQHIILQVREDVETGSSLANALKKHPQAFSDLYVNMVAAGEAGGILDTILQRLATYIEKAARLKAQVKSAMIYPVTVIAIAILVVYVILWKVIPVFASLFESLGASLPLPTRVVVELSNFVGRFWWLIAILVVAGIVAVRQYYKTPQGKLVIDNLMLKAPVLGMVLRKIAVARFCRTLGTLLSAGVPVLESLEITARTSGNAVIERAILEVRKQVEEGKALAEPLKATNQFPPMVVQMIGVGEATGAMDTMLSKIAEFYEDEVDTAVAGMMKLIEPVMIFFLGVVIGGIVIAMYLPMFDLISKIG